MKTRLIIEFETSNMKRVVPEEYIGKDEECPDDELMTKEIEDGLHIRFVYLIKQMLEKGTMEYDRFEERMMEDDNSVEGFDDLDDYGDVTITVKDES